MGGEKGKIVMNSVGGRRVRGQGWTPVVVMMIITIATMTTAIAAHLMRAYVPGTVLSV